MGWVKVKDRLPKKSFNFQQKVRVQVKYGIFFGLIKRVIFTDYYFNDNPKHGWEKGFKPIGHKIKAWYEEDE